jgi:hypothetical protein
MPICIILSEDKSGMTKPAIVCAVVAQATWFIASVWIHAGVSDGQLCCNFNAKLVCSPSVKKLTTVGLRRYSAALWNWINQSDFAQEPTCRLRLKCDGTRAKNQISSLGETDDSI